MATPDYSLGVDVSIRSGPNGDDLDGTFGEIYGAQVVLEDTYKTVTTTSGSLEWDPSGTLDVTELLGDDTTSADAAALQAQIGALLDLDPRIRTVSAQVQYDPTSSVEAVNISVTTVTGETFAMSIPAGQNAVDVEQTS